MLLSACLVLLESSVLPDAHFQMVPARALPDRIQKQAVASLHLAYLAFQESIVFLGASQGWDQEFAQLGHFQ